MRKLLLFVLCCVAIVLALGFYLDWFNLRTRRTPEGQSEYTFSVDRERVKQDVSAARKRADEVAGSAREYFADHTVEGTVDSVDVTEATMSIRPEDDKPILKVRVDKDTKIQAGEGAGRNLTLADVRPGARVTVVYEARKEYNRAKSITISAQAVGLARR